MSGLREKYTREYPGLERLIGTYFIPYWWEDDPIEQVVAGFIYREGLTKLDGSPQSEWPMRERALEDLRSLRARYGGDDEKAYADVIDVLAGRWLIFVDSVTASFDAIERVLSNPEQYPFTPPRERYLTKASSFPDVETANAVSTEVLRANEAIFRAWCDDASRPRLALQHFIGRDIGVLAVGVPTRVERGPKVYVRMESRDAVAQTGVVVFARREETAEPYVLTAYASETRPGADGRMAAAAYPALFQLFAGYLNEEWADEYDYPEDAVRHFVRDMPRELVRQASDELAHIRGELGDTEQTMSLLLELENGSPSGPGSAYGFTEYLDLIAGELATEPRDET